MSFILEKIPVPVPVTKGGTGTTTQFTAGSVVVAGTNGVYLENNNNFFWNNASGFLGIGTGATTPQTRLQLNKINTGSYIANTDFALLIQGDTLGIAHPGIAFSLSANNPTKPKSAIIPYATSNGSGVGLGSSTVYTTGINSVPLWANFCGGVLIGGSTTFPSATLASTIVVTQAALSSGSRGEVLINTASHTAQTASTERVGFYYKTATVQFATGAKTNQREWLIEAPTYSAVGATTITNGATFALSGAPIAGTNVTITNPYTFWAMAGISKFDGRLQFAQGADVASANDLTLGTDGNTFEITGTTQINAISTSLWQNGSLIELMFTSTPTVMHNTAGGAGTAVVLLAGSGNFVATAGSRLGLKLSEIGGTQAWREMYRAAA